MTLPRTNRTGALSQREFERNWTRCYNWIARQKWQSKEWEIAARLYDYLLYRARRRMVPTMVLTGIENEKARRWARLDRNTIVAARNTLLRERVIEVTKEDGRGKMWTYRLLDPKREPLATWKRFESRYVDPANPSALLMEGSRSAPATPFVTADHDEEDGFTAQNAAGDDGEAGITAHCAVLSLAELPSGESWQDSDTEPA